MQYLTSPPILACFLLAPTAGAYAMTAHVDAAGPRCVVSGAKHLPPGSGGERALCGEIARVLAPVGAAVLVQVEVRSPHRLLAVAKLPDGRTLPAINLAVSDARLSARSFRRLAAALAAQVKSHRR